MCTRSFPGVKYGRWVTLTPHPLLVPRSKKHSRGRPLFSLRAFVAIKMGESYLNRHCFCAGTKCNMSCRLPINLERQLFRRNLIVEGLKCRDASKLHTLINTLFHSRSGVLFFHRSCSGLTAIYWMNSLVGSERKALDCVFHYTFLTALFILLPFDKWSPSIVKYSCL